MSLNTKVLWEQWAITNSPSSDGKKLSYREVTDFVPYSKAKPEYRALVLKYGKCHADIKPRTSVINISISRQKSTTDTFSLFSSL